MARNPKTGFDRYFTKRVKAPEFATVYKTARADTDAIDALVRAIDAARESEGLSKAELANRADMRPEQVRRLFTARASNPTVATLVKLAGALNCRVEVTPISGRRSKAARVSAREVRRR